MVQALAALASGRRGQISLLKRKYGWRKTKNRGDVPNEIAIGWGASRITSSCCRVWGYRQVKGSDVGGKKVNIEGDGVIGDASS